MLMLMDCFLYLYTLCGFSLYLYSISNNQQRLDLLPNYKPLVNDSNEAIPQI